MPNDTIRNNWSLRELTLPAYQPVTLTTAHQHLRLFTEFGQHPDDHLIKGYIAAATAAAEQYTQRYFAQRQIRLFRDNWPSLTSVQTGRGFAIIEDALHLELPLYPVVSVDSISYVDEDGNTQPLTDFEVDVDRVPSVIRIESPPGLKRGLKSITIDVTAGYPSDDSPASADYVPEAVKQAILLMVGQFYEHRENVVVGTITSQLPAAFEYLLQPYRVLGV